MMIICKRCLTPKRRRRWYDRLFPTCWFGHVWAQRRPMEVKLFEIRDNATFIPAIGIAMESGDDAEHWLLRRAGYGQGRLILFARLDGGGKAEYDAFAWPNRTMHGAHRYIEEHWDELKSGQVVDARVGLGEATEHAKSERYT